MLSFGSPFNLLVARPFITLEARLSKPILLISGGILMAKTESRSSGGRHERLILALMQNANMERAAAAAGISEATLRRRMRDPEFQEEYRAARREAFRQAIVRLQHASGAAVSTLLRVMADQTAPASSRVRAASCVLERSREAMELEDIEVRLSKIEERAIEAESRKRDRR
jgi:hypothetical protein